MMKTKEERLPDRISTYFLAQIPTLIIITITGLVYNIGMIAGPWFEGQLAQCLCNVLQGSQTLRDMQKLALAYVVVIFLVQTFRFFKRLYVRKFANNIGKDMKTTIYRTMIHKTAAELRQENTGAMMTKAIADADACSEGMRKFTTEIFDTGVVMVAYLSMLLWYDWKLTMIVMLFPPIAYFMADRLKKAVSRSTAAARESAGRLNEATLDRVSNALTYRVYGQEEQHNQYYEDFLTDYEQKNVRANLWETSVQPIYQVIAMIGTFFILWLGGKNVIGTGFQVWDIATFSTFLSCFLKLAVKSSKAAKLFNAVQKARVSWGRIKPYLQQRSRDEMKNKYSVINLEISSLFFQYPNGAKVLAGIDLAASQGQIIGVTGEVASGKSTFGAVFLNESPYEGSIRVDGVELADLVQNQASDIVGYQGHKPELMSASIEENIQLGEMGDAAEVLKMVCLDKEVDSMPQGIHTQIGGNGRKLSGGQQARLALARTLYHRRPIIILDDPFSAVDRQTEYQIMENLRTYYKDCIIILISHRISLFDRLDGVLWLDHGRGRVETHETLIQNTETYRKLYRFQTGDDANE